MQIPLLWEAGGRASGAVKDVPNGPKCHPSPSQNIGHNRDRIQESPAPRCKVAAPREQPPAALHWRRPLLSAIVGLSYFLPYFRPHFRHRTEIKGLFLDSGALPIIPSLSFQEQTTRSEQQRTMSFDDPAEAVGVGSASLVPPQQRHRDTCILLWLTGTRGAIESDGTPPRVLSAASCNIQKLLS
jgi:hypothetical protein